MAKYIKVLARNAVEFRRNIPLMDTTPGKLYKVVGELYGGEYFEFIDDVGDSADINVEYHVSRGSVEIIED